MAHSESGLVLGNSGDGFAGSPRPRARGDSIDTNSCSRSSRPQSCFIAQVAQADAPTIPLDPWTPTAAQRMRFGSEALSLLDMRASAFVTLPAPISGRKLPL